MILYPIIQGSESWERLRVGKAGASEARKVITSAGQPSTSRKAYMRRLARECVCEDPLKWSGSKHTDWGTEMEPEARNEIRAILKDLTGSDITEHGYLTREDRIIGCSPDGLALHGEIQENWSYTPVEMDFGIEIKAPQVDTHVEYVMDGALPALYKQQVHWSMAASGIKKWYFMSYFPGLNPLIVEVKADHYTDLVRKAQDDFLIDYSRERELVFSKIMPGYKPQETKKAKVLVDDLI